MPFTTKDKLKSILCGDCFIPSSGDSITFKQDHQLACDGETKKQWTQKLTITGLEGDEIFFSFDGEDHKQYSPYILGQNDKFYAKACDYVMLKKINDRWIAYIGELKMRGISAPEVDMQTKGTQAFLEYIKAVLNLDNFQELNNLKVIRKVIGCKKLVRARHTNRRRPTGTVQRRPVSPLNLTPETELLDKNYPYNDIVSTRLLFNDSDRNHMSIKLSEFLAEA